MPPPLEEQAVVITGASSGIGRVTALELGKRRASVVLAARNAAALQEVAAKVERLGGRAHSVVTDLGEWAQVRRLAEEAIAVFGRIDTWINNAAVTTYAAFEQMTVDEIDRVLRVDLLGSIYGAKAALPYMRRQHAGTLIFVGSALGDRSLPLMSLYCTAKHGIKGFVESLRLELDRERSGIAVTLLHLASINTPFDLHAGSKLGARPRPYPPVYEPDVVAEAILHAAVRPRRDIYVGGAAKLLAALERVSPSLVDRYMLQGDRAVRNLLTDQPDAGQNNLFAPAEGLGRSHGDFGRQARATSLYTRCVELHPGRTQFVIGAAMLAAGILARRAPREMAGDDHVASGGGASGGLPRPAVYSRSSGMRELAGVD